MPGTSKILRKAGWTFLILAAIAFLVSWYYHQKDYTAYFQERRGKYRHAEVQAAGGDSVFDRSWLKIVNDHGLTVDCGLLMPKSGGRHPAVVVLGGKATGKHAIDYAFDIKDVLIIAVDYPYQPRPSYTIPQFLTDVPGIRGALLDMVPSVMLLLDYLRTRPDVDTNRIILVGYSFGAPLVPVIIASDPRPAFAAMVFGGGDLQGLIRHNVRRTEGPLTSEFVGMLGGLLLRPLEPLRYADLISPVPLLMINGTEDEQIPRAYTEALYDAAAEPKQLIWLESRHVRKENIELTRTITRLLREKLAQAGMI